MEHQGIEDYGEAQDEEFPEEFMCCVCLDIMYKPVVLACGHISCFWCTFKSMDTFHESHCPVCRHPYNHFPRICDLLHFLLLKSYPSAYKRREKQVAVEEKSSGHASPEFDSNLIDSQLSKVNATCEGENGFVQDSPQRTSHEDDTTNPTTSSSQTTSNEAHFVVDTNKVLAADLQCAVCKQLLYRPVVLNCGHVYCETCIHRDDSVCKCPVCQSAHPRGFPNVCLVLEHFLEEHFPEEYSARKESLPHSQSSAEKQEQAAQSSSGHQHLCLPCLSGQTGAELHPGVGCDYCGMCPIVGVRYRCKDCVEAIGFDLCEGCHNSSSKRPGRFNQQHTENHQFEVVAAPNLRNLLQSLGAFLPGGDNETGVISDNDAIRIVRQIIYDPEYPAMGVSTDNPEENLTVNLSNVASQNELETTQSLVSPDDDPEDLENTGAPPNPSNHRSQDRDGDSLA